MCFAPSKEGEVTNPGSTLLFGAVALRETLRGTPKGTLGGA